MSKLLPFILLSVLFVFFLSLLLLLLLLLLLSSSTPPQDHVIIAVGHHQVGWGSEVFPTLFLHQHFFPSFQRCFCSY